MGNFFSSKQVYGPKWQLVNSRSFTDEEINMVEEATVVPSEYGLSICFHMKAGGSIYTPVSRDSNVSAGETINLESAKILTLEREGESIERIEF